MAVEKKHEQEHENEERWLLTYADLITLLMVFFVVMYAMSKSDVAKFQQMAQTLKAAFDNPMGSKQGFQGKLKRVVELAGGPPSTSAGEYEGPGRRGGEGGGRHRRSQEIEQLRRQFDEVMKRAASAGASVNVSMNKDETALIVRLSDSLLFTPGSADLTPDARPLMDKVADVLKSTNKQIRVEGHTDNIPINNPRYPSNWELSTARAVTVLRYMVDAHQISPEHLSAGGYGEFRPIQPNDSPEHRSANRRVEFVILDEDVSKEKGATEVETPSAASPAPPPATTPVSPSATPVPAPIAPPNPGGV